MIIPFTRNKRNSNRRVPCRNRSLGEDLVLQQPSTNSSLGTTNKHVVIVMDALKDFSHETLQWALDNVIASGYMVTLLGVMPWLNLPLSCKTSLNVWMLDLEDLSALKEKNEWKSDIKYQKLRRVIELCDKYGVVPQMKVAMGYPLRLLVAEQSTSLQATWVVFDRHFRKHRSYYAKKIPCNVVMMNSNGEVDILRVRPMIDGTTPTESPLPLLPAIIPRVIISDRLMEMLRRKDENITKETTNIDHEETEISSPVLDWCI